MHIVHAVVPGLPRIHINFPSSILVRCLSPVWHSKSLIEDSRSSVEGNIANTFKQSLRVEVLSVHVMHDVRFLMEFLVVHIFNSQSYSIIIN